MTSLTTLRETIASLDGEILRLVTARMDAARAIGRCKQEQSIPLRDFDVERQVLDRATQTAEQLGLSRDLATCVMKLLIRESCAAQEALQYPVQHSSAGEVLIIGGLGKMGRWFGGFFRNQGFRVRVTDTSSPQDDDVAIVDLSQGLKSADIAMIATPLDSVPLVIDQVSAMSFAGTLVDVASLKSHLKLSISAARQRGQSITSIHPMFGADARALSDRVICICDCGDAGATQRIAAIFRDTAATLVSLSLDEHDRLMSYVLGLSHLINIAFAAALVDSGLSNETLRRVGSTTFLSQMCTTAPVVCENADLYYLIQRFNSFTPTMHSDISRALSSLIEMVGYGDREGFIAMMSRSRAWIGGEEKLNHDAH